MSTPRPNYGKRNATSPKENMAKNPKNSSLSPHETNLDLLVKVEFLTLNDKPFLGQISEDELLYLWVKVFDRSIDEVFGVTSAKSLTRNVRATFKLKSPIKLEEAFKAANFRYEKFLDDGSSEVITGKILGFGVDKPAEIGEITTVTVKTNFGIEASGVINWLRLYGTITESKGFVASISTDKLNIKSDTFKAEILLNRHIEEYLPMYGQKAQVHYPGIPRQCNRCYGVGHMRRDCNNTKKDWVPYVMSFIKNGVNIELVGSWKNAIQRWENANLNKE